VPGDSLRAPRSDSLAAPGDSLSVARAGSLAPADTLARVAPRAPGWDRAWLMRELAPAARDTLISRETLASSSGLVLADALERDSSLGLFRGGAQGAWETPYLVGPGVDRLSLWDDAFASAGPAIPEAALVSRSLMPLQRIVRLQPDPLLDPLGNGLDGLLWCERVGVPPVGTSSAFRLTEGPSGARTEDFGLERGRGAWRLTSSYAHSRSLGRPAWVRPRYTGCQNQDLNLGLDRALGGSTITVTATDRTGRSVLEPNRKLIWQAQRLAAGWQKLGRRGAIEVALARRNDLLRWGGEAGEDRRRSTSTEAHARGALDLGGPRLLACASAEQVSLALRETGGVALSKEPRGTGCAIGVGWSGARRSLYAAAGWSDPWWGRGHARAHLLLDQRVAGLRFALEGETHATAPFTPRLEGDGRALIEEGVLLVDGTPAEPGPLRRVNHAEARIEAGAGERSVRAGFYMRDIEHAVGADPLLAGALTPEARGLEPAAALSGDVRLRAVYGNVRLPLVLGARIEADGTWLLGPKREALPVLVPRYHARAVFAIGRTLFSGDLTLEARFVALLRDRWTTPYGERPALERYDAELRGRMGRAHFFLALRHLTNEAQDSATYAEGEWMPLPFRSSQVGVEWHFLD
jgi:hypothetical protein